MRVKKGHESRRHKKVLKLAKGYKLQRSKIFRRAKESILHSGQYNLIHRRHRKSQIRRLWIRRITAVVQTLGLSYSVFINKLKKNNIELNRKSLSQLAVLYPEVFKQVVEKVK